MLAILFPINTPTELIISDAECAPSAIIALDFPIIPANILIIAKTIFHNIDIIVTLLASQYLDSIFIPLILSINILKLK